MTDASSRGEGSRELAATDGISRRSIRETLAVVRDRPAVLVGLAVALLGPSIFRTLLIPVLAPLEAWFLLAIGPFWIATIILVGFVLWVERRPLASLGAAWPSWSDLRVGLVGTAGGLLTVPVTLPLTNALGFRAGEEALASILQFPLWAVFVLVITAAVTEEVLFRAYPIERLAEITGSIRVAAGLSLVAFMLLHVPAWGVGHLITISGISLILTVLYARYRRIGPVMVMHFLTNFFLLIVFPILGWI